MATKRTFRVNTSGGIETRKISPLQAIRHQCRECCGFSAVDIEECPSILCSLHPFRMGKDPGRAPASEKQRETARRNALNTQRGGQKPAKN